MMPERDDHTDRDLDLLVAGHLDDALDAASARRLHERLRTDEAARRLLLAAATQASVLPRTALEAGLAGVKTSVQKPRRSVGRRWWSAVAALLVLGVCVWWLSYTAESDALLAASGDLRVVRADRQATAMPWVQVGDRVEVGANGARLDWTNEGTGIDLQAGATLEIEQLGTTKRLRLRQGELTAEVAPQGAGGLTVTTPFGEIVVIGTRFRVAVDGVAATVAVEHGAVRVRGLNAATPVTVDAGYAVRLTQAGGSVVPAPLARLPSTPGASVPSTSTVVRLGIETFGKGEGWEGDLVDGAIRGRPVVGSPVTRVTTPAQRPAGIVPFGENLQLTVDLTVDQPTTLAVLLVCDHPAGGSRWLANIQAEQRISAGAQQVTFTATDFRLTTSGPFPPAGSRIVAAAVMTWQPAADLRLRTLTFTR
jgi:ferric-dicitrate binding protein FerR (iron transport regulator)